MKTIKYLPLVFLLGIFSCTKVIDGPISVPKPNFTQIEIDLLENYPNKVYYNLANKQVVKTSPSLDWDIAFSANILEGNKFITNYARGISGFVLNTYTTDFSQTYTDDYIAGHTANIHYCSYYENTGNVVDTGLTLSGDSLISDKMVYIINYGIGYQKKKMQILSYKANQVIFKLSNLDNSNLQTITLPLDAHANYTYFDYETSAAMQIEPSDKSSWDIEFTAYTSYIYDFNQPQYYRVVGALYNPSQSYQTAIIPNISIDQVTLSTAQVQTYTNSPKGIGYQWKSYSDPSANGYYTILTRTYVVQKIGTYYALQFLSFSKIVGGNTVNGYPVFLQNQLN